LKQEIQTFEVEKFLVPTVEAILKDFSHKMVPFTGMPDVQACWYHAKRIFSSLLYIDSLPVFLSMADVPHLSACSLISLFFTIFEFRVDGGRPSHLAMSVLFSDGFFSTSSMMHSRSSKVRTCFSGNAMWDKIVDD
jgi:hypothetical protein